MPDIQSIPLSVGLVSVSADYSEDELDVIAEVYSRSRLRRRRAEAGEDEKVRRAVADAVLRGLVARRALVLGGTADHPRIRFLEPHSTLLNPMVGAEATVTARLAARGRVTARVLFARGGVMVEQQALPGMAIRRMTAHPREVLPAMALDGLPAPADQPAPEGEAFEIDAHTLTRIEQAIDAGEPLPADVPELAADLMHARTATATVRVVRREKGGTVVDERVGWFDAGLLGLWCLEAPPDGRAGVVRLVPTSGEALLSSLEAILAPAAQVDPPPPGQGPATSAG